MSTCVSASPILTSVSVFKETLLCFGKVTQTWPWSLLHLSIDCFAFWFCCPIVFSCIYYLVFQIVIIDNTLACFFTLIHLQMLNLPDLLKENTVLPNLLKAFQPTEISDCFFQGMQLIPSLESMDYLYSGAYNFLEGVFDVGMFSSFHLSLLLLNQHKEKKVNCLLNYPFCSNKLFIYTGFRSLADVRMHGYIHPHIP